MKTHMLMSPQSCIIFYYNLGNLKQLDTNRQIRMNHLIIILPYVFYQSNVSPSQLGIDLLWVTKKFILDLVK